MRGLYGRERKGVNNMRGEKLFKVVANDDALKYQVIDLEKSEIVFEHDSKLEASQVSDVLNDLKDEFLDQVYRKVVLEWEHLYGETSLELRLKFKELVYGDSNENNLQQDVAKLVIDRVLGSTNSKK